MTNELLASVGKKVVDIKEFDNLAGDLVIVEITFEDNTRIVFRSDVTTHLTIES
jgi:hypothetical protein